MSFLGFLYPCLFFCTLSPKNCLDIFSCQQSLFNSITQKNTYINPSIFPKLELPPCIPPVTTGGGSLIFRQFRVAAGFTVLIQSSDLWLNLRTGACWQCWLCLSRVEPGIIIIHLHFVRFWLKNQSISLMICSHEIKFSARLHSHSHKLRWSQRILVHKHGFVQVFFLHVM